MNLPVWTGTFAAVLLLAPAVRADSFAAQTEEARSAAGAGRHLEAYEALKRAELTLWNSMPRMALRRTVLVTEEPPFFGAYTPRENNRYHPGEPILLYVEPVGYTIVKTDDVYSYSLTADVSLLEESGNVLGGQKDFGRWQFASRRPVTEFMMYFTFDFSGLDGGDYLVETVIRDQNSEKTVTFSTPVVIVP